MYIIALQSIATMRCSREIEVNSVLLILFAFMIFITDCRILVSEMMGPTYKMQSSIIKCLSQKQWHDSSDPDG